MNGFDRSSKKDQEKALALYKSLIEGFTDFLCDHIPDEVTPLDAQMIINSIATFSSRVIKNLEICTSCNNEYFRNLFNLHFMANLMTLDNIKDKGQQN